jgi:hypothetical protein
MEFDKGLTAYVTSDAQVRLVIHQYFESKGIPQTGIRCDLFDSQEGGFLVRCYCCNKRAHFTSANYRPGSVENNNWDEYYLKTCLYCDRPINYEPNYDDGRFMLPDHNNMVVVGVQLGHRRKPKKAVSKAVTEEEFAAAVEKAKVFQLPNPTAYLNRPGLIAYVTGLLADMRGAK